ncbi:MAG: substrate-binding domain-containing protein [Bacteroidia bacterium]|nr:substrate-binding domain-containing protein [Bacteroidia bacterium]MDW8134791.1 substrate-binding domain-containing protein [Bacteroidia bacterium]
MWRATFQPFYGSVLPALRKLLLLSPFLLAVSAGGCNAPPGVQDTPTSGSVHIAADMSLYPALQPVLEQFHRTYPNAHIEITYTTEKQAVEGLLADSFRVVIITRPFTKAESLALTEQRIRPKQTRIAREGIAVIGYPFRQDSLLSVDTLVKWLLDRKSPYTFVIEGGAGSGIYRYLIDTLLRGRKPEATLYRADSIGKIIQYVQQNPRAIGLIGVAWVCDREDSTTQKFLRSVRLFALQAARGDKAYYYPYAGYLRPGFYPLSRDVYALSREPRVGLGSGFVSYLAGPDGQRILLKSGLLPAIAPVRIVELKEENIFQKQRE